MSSINPIIADKVADDIHNEYLERAALERLTAEMSSSRKRRQGFHLSSLFRNRGRTRRPSAAA